MRARAATWIGLGVLVASCRPVLSGPTYPLVRTPDAQFRRTAPPPTPLHTYSPPTVEASTLADGMHVLRIPSMTDGRSTVMYVNRIGGEDESAVTAGVASFTCEAIAAAANGNSREGTETAGFEFVGRTSRDNCTITTRLNDERLAEALTQLASAVRTTHLDPQWITSHVAQRLEQRTASGAESLLSVVEAARFGVAHPYGRPMHGLPRDLASIGTARLNDYKLSHYRPSESAIVLVTNRTTSELNGALSSAFGDWAAAEMPRPAPPPELPPSTVARAEVIDRTTSPVTLIALAERGPSRASPDYAAASVLNAVLGSLVTSRLSVRIRESEQLGYAVTSEYVALRSGGVFRILGAVENDAAPRSVALVHDAMTSLIAEPISPAELHAAVSITRGRLIDQLSSDIGRADFVAQMFTDDLPASAASDLLRAISAVTEHDVLRVAAAYLQPSALHYIILGNAFVLTPSLRGLGLEVVEHGVSPMI